MVAWFVLTLQMRVLYYNVKRLALVGPSSFPWYLLGSMVAKYLFRYTYTGDDFPETFLARSSCVAPVGKNIPFSKGIILTEREFSLDPKNLGKNLVINTCNPALGLEGRR